MTLFCTKEEFKINFNCWILSLYLVLAHNLQSTVNKSKSYGKLDCSQNETKSMKVKTRKIGLRRMHALGEDSAAVHGK